MKQLAEEDYGRARSVFSELSAVHLNIISVLDNRSPGEVYVDDVDDRQAAYLVSCDGHYLAGTPRNSAFNTALHARLPRDSYFVLFCDVPRWQIALESVLKNTYAVRARRSIYTLRQHSVSDWQDSVPEAFSMRIIDADCLAQGLNNGDDVVEAILGEWCSLDLFLKHGFGFCSICDDDIASWCFSDYVGDDRCEIGVYTSWNYRRQGLGALTAAATAANAIDRGFSRIDWHCWANNSGSIGVAENVGFEWTLDYDVFINHWAAENVTDMTQDEFREFAEYYECAFEVQSPSSGFPYIVAAKAWALSGDRGGCFRHLNKAADIGWLRNVEHLREIWPELFYSSDLEQMKEWQELVGKFGN